MNQIRRWMDLLLGLVRSTANFGRVLIRSRNHVHRRIVRLAGERSSAECLVCVNGPSLKDDIARTIDSGKPFNGDVLCVNGMATVEVFQRLRPRLYVLMDRLYWDGNVAAQYTKIRDETIQAIVARTRWKMLLFVPWQARRLSCYEALTANPNVRFVPFNATWIRRGLPAIDFFFLRRNLGILAPFSVLVPSLLLAINLGYRDIVVLGADHSWHEFIRMGKDNILRSQANYNYINDGEPHLVPLEGYGGEKMTIAEFFRTYYHVFDSYESIRRYGRRRGCRIVNDSAKSFIDAFDRT